MTDYSEHDSRSAAESAEPAQTKLDDSLPLEIRGAKQQLTELLAKWQRQARGLVAVNNIARVIVSSQDIESVLAAAVHEIEESLTAGHAQVILLDPETRQHVYYSLGGMKGLRPIVEGEDGLQDVAAQVIHSGQSMRLDRAGRTIAAHVHAALCVPLLASDRVVGAIQVTDKLQHRTAGKTACFDEFDQEVLEGLAAFVAMAVENARLQEATRAQAAAQALQETVVTLAHYVNNPLQGMVAAAELLKERLEQVPQECAVALDGENSVLGLLDVIIDNAQAISAVLRLLQDTHLPQSTRYLGSEQMLDIEAELQAKMQSAHS